MTHDNWEHFHHEADIGVRGLGRSPDRAFEQAALALTAVITDLDSVQGVIPVSIHCECNDLELLLTDWLNALVYEMATRHMLFSRFQVTIEDGKLNAVAWGEPIDLQRHKPAVEIKGATYTELAVTQADSGHWAAQCVVDV
ncbi:MAG: archease [Candidatus Sedimenticola sp. 20ELBAFRAG]